jgi:hypothetical protein
MFGPTFDDYYRKAIEIFNQDILRESDEQILGSEIDDLANFYCQKYALIPLAFDSADLSYEMKKEVRRVPAHQRDEFYRHEGDLDFEYESAVVSIPIQSNPNLDWLKKLSGPVHHMDGFDKRVVYGPNEISFSFDVKWYGGHSSEDSIANEINTKSQRLIESLNQKNSSIESGNALLLKTIKDVIAKRKEKLVSDKEKLNTLTQKIKIPLKQKPSPSATKIHVDVKKFVHLVKPTPKLPEEYTLEESILKDILGFVDNQCRTFERTPGAYKQLGEEQLRDVILSALNGIFEGNATGETFVKKGKTDIHLKIEKGEILIFECKNWGGEKIYLDTIDQLMGYVTWRQNYGVVIMFSKNRDFSKILTQIPDIIQKHTQYKSGFKQLSSNHFVSDHTLPEDSGKTIKIHHLIYNIYSE